MKNYFDRHFVIICGWIDSKEKEYSLIELLKKVKKIDKVDICYVTHCSNIPEEVYGLSDYVIFNKENVILNWDIIDDFTRTFGSKIDFDQGKQVVYYQPYHGYAHFVSMCDGLLLGANLRYNTFTIMNYDVIDDCVERLERDMKVLQMKQKDAVFFSYAKTYLNTEYFTFNLDVAKALFPYRDYYRFCEFENMMLESIVTEIVKKNDFMIEVYEHGIEDDSLGNFNFTLRPPDIKHRTNMNYFIPFYNQWINGVNSAYYYIPIQHKGKKYICRVDETEGLMKGEIYINDKLVCTDMSGKAQIEALTEYPCTMKVYIDNHLKANIYLHDERQFGVYFEKSKQKEQE